MTQPATPISHALVLPDRDFNAWLDASKNYQNGFERVAIIRSPAGFNLNRFRNITAVEVAGEWLNNDALAHIRRMYPAVVRVDVIRVNTPAELAAELNRRVSEQDRYGEKRNTPPHIFDRLTIDWPVDTFQTRIVRKFNDKAPDGKLHEGLDLHAPAGSTVRSGTAGTVATVVRQTTALGYGQYVQIGLTHGGENFLITYGGLDEIAVQMGQTISKGTVIGKVGAGRSTIKLVVQHPGKGKAGYALPDVIDPTPLIYYEGLRLRSTTTLNVRDKPTIEGQVIDRLTTNEYAETLELHGRMLAMVGTPEKDNQWLQVRTPRGREGYAAAWYMQAVGPRSTVSMKVKGMNLDLDNPRGRPDPALMKGIDWVRIKYNVSFNPNNNTHGNRDLQAAYNRFQPFIKRYKDAGMKVVLVLGHQVFGEGAGYVWPQMNTDKWRELTVTYSEFCKQIAAQYAGQNLVDAYQIWNEQDTKPEHMRAAVPIPPRDYAHLLSETIKKMRPVAGNAKIITGGHVTGGGDGVRYAKETVAAMPSGVRPDGIALHAYGIGPAGNRWSIFGPLADTLREYAKVLPSAPLWITEWGVLDVQGKMEFATSIAEYAVGFLDIVRTQFAGQVEAACWYAWADGMDNGYGLVDAAGNPKPSLYDRYLKE